MYRISLIFPIMIIINNIVIHIHSCPTVQDTLLGLRQQLLQLLTEQSSLPKEIQILATLRKLDSLLVDRQLALERHDNDALANLDEKVRESEVNRFFLALMGAKGG